MTTLVLIESAGKIHTLKDILGSKYEVMASLGHIIDLEPGSMSIDISNNFEPKYTAIKGKEEIISKLKKAAKKSNGVLIATDEDREGEMIAWSLAHILNIKDAKRVTFKSITKDVVLKSIKNPRKIDQPMVDAQKARRILDRIVGYEISPILWKNIQDSSSAGRVQSVVARLIVDKEREIEEFYKKASSSSFKFTGMYLDKKNKQFAAQLYQTKNVKKTKSDEEQDEDEKEIQFIKGDKAKIKTEKEAKELLRLMTKTIHRIGDIEEKESTRNPSPPFTTSTLQQEAAKKLGYSLKRTMTSAQHLYEAGYITYMRTDSVALSKEALDNIKEYVVEKYGEEYYKMTQYTSKAKNTQEAHEAIRPADASVETAANGGKIGSDEIKLYNLIWKRAISSQMMPAKYKIKSIQILMDDIEDYYYMTQIQNLIFEGFMAVYNIKNVEEESEEANDEDAEEDNNTGITIPAKGVKIIINKIDGIQEYQRPPSRYNEGSLTNKLDPKNLNIGRPATTASVINKIQERGYVKKDDCAGIEKQSVSLKWELKDGKTKESKNKITIGKETGKLMPTEIGIKVNDFLVENFADIMEYKFTADMEDKLDLIAEGESKWNKVLEEFYENFHPTVLKLMDKKTTVVDKNTRVLGKHPKSGKEILATIGKYGPMIKMATEDNKYMYAPISEPLTIDSISLDDAIKLMQYPKTLGLYNKIPVVLNKGKYGMYITCDGMSVNIDTIEDKDNITLKEAVELIVGKKKDILWEAKDGKLIYTMKEKDSSRYIMIRDTMNKTAKPKFIPVPKSVDIKTLSIDQVKEMGKYNKEKKKNSKSNASDSPDKIIKKAVAKKILVKKPIISKKYMFD